MRPNVLKWLWVKIRIAWSTYGGPGLQVWTHRQIAVCQSFAGARNGLFPETLQTKSGAQQDLGLCNITTFVRSENQVWPFTPSEVCEGGRFSSGCIYTLVALVLLVLEGQGCIYGNLPETTFPGRKNV